MSDRDGWVPVDDEGWPLWSMAGPMRATVEDRLDDYLLDNGLDPRGYSVEPCGVMARRGA